jgi:hypothetical protein
MLARSLHLAAAFTVASLAFAACAGSNEVMGLTGTTGATGGSAGATGSSSSVTSSGTGAGGAGQTACIQNNCTDDAECGACPNGDTLCDPATHRCVACGVEGKTCPSGTTCGPSGNCVPSGATCPTDATGKPTVTCTTSADCEACDPLHQVCDMATGACVACTSIDSSACQSTDQCVGDACKPDCPATCATDDDCSACGATGNFAHACNAGKCAQCSATYACPSGKVCTPNGTCADKCGQDGNGACTGDGDCPGCGAGNTICHSSLGGPGVCGPQAGGCSDLGQGSLVLPAPWNEVTNLCSHDSDCAGVGITLDVGAILRDITGIDAIKDADLDYGMNVCAAVTVGGDFEKVSCGVCVPCRVDTDCQPIDVDAIADEAFGPVGSVAAAVLLDEVFGPSDHEVHMYCQDVAGGYGVCAPCPGILYACGGN